MVIYDLICANFHTFEGWFKDNADFKSQQDSGLVACPACDNAEIKIKPSKLAIAGKKSNQMSGSDSGLNTQKDPSAKEEKEQSSPKAIAPQNSDAMHFNSSEEQMSVLRDFVEKNFEDVGSNFTDEVRKMHYGETDQRGIRGNATKQEVKSLEEEGIDTFAIPVNGIDKTKLN